MATQITATSGWTATANTTTLCDELMRQGGQDALTNAGQLYYMKSTESDYRVDEETGRIDLLTGQFESQWYPYDPNATSFPRGSHNIFVDYTAGYTQNDNVPMALQEVAWELVATSYNQSRHDQTVASESLDGYSYSTRSQVDLRDDQLERMYR